MPTPTFILYLKRQLCCICHRWVWCRVPTSFVCELTFSNSFAIRTTEEHSQPSGFRAEPWRETSEDASDTRVRRGRGMV